MKVLILSSSEELQQELIKNNITIIKEREIDFILDYVDAKETDKNNLSNVDFLIFQKDIIDFRKKYFFDKILEYTKEQNILCVLEIYNLTKENKIKALEQGVFDLILSQEEIKETVLKMKNIFEVLKKYKYKNKELSNKKFTYTEKMIFDYLLKNKDKIVSSDDIFNNCLDNDVYNFRLCTNSELIKSFIYKIRVKIQNTDYELINIKNRGYMLKEKTQI